MTLRSDADGTQTDYVHAPEGGQSYSSYTVQKDKAGTVTEEDLAPLTTPTGDVAGGDTPGGGSSLAGAAGAATVPSSAQRPGQTGASTSTSWAGPGVTDTSGGALVGSTAAGGTATTTPGDGAAASTGQTGPGGSGPGGGPTAGVTVDASGRVHVDIAPVSTSYAPAGDAPAVEDNSGGTTVRLGPIGLTGASASGAAGTNDGSGLTLAGDNLTPIVTGGTPAQALVPGPGQGGSGGDSGGGTGLAAGASAVSAATPAMGDVTGLPGLDDMTQDGTPLPGSGDGALSAQGSGKVMQGRLLEVAGVLTMGAGAVVTGGGVLTTPEGVGVPVTAGGVEMMAAGAGAAYAGKQLVQEGQADMAAPTLAPMPAPNAGLSSVAPGVAPPGTSLSGASVNPGDLSAMTGVGASTIPANPGFTPAPPLAPLPGFSATNLPLPPFSTPIADTALPTSTGATGPTVNLGDWQEGFSTAQPIVPTTFESVQTNKAAGDAYEAEVIANTLPQTQDNIQPQITIKSGGPSGLNVRLDALGTDTTTGSIRLSDMKASQTAPLTPNQKVVYPELQQYGGQIVGEGKIPYVGGTKIPPTIVDIIRKP